MAETEKNPHDLVKHSDVEKTLKVDKGADATLESFEVVDFTTKGDNYACLVSSVVVQYKKSGKSCETSYVVKLNPGRTGFIQEFMGKIFHTEIEFYHTILPLLNKELFAANETSLHVPRSFNFVRTKDQEVIYLEDLRISGFKMHDRTKTMDQAHTSLILKELARLHAASTLLFAREGLQNKEKILEKYPTLEGIGKEIMEDMEKRGMKVYEAHMEGSATLTDPLPEYKFVSEFLRAKKTTIAAEMVEAMESFGKFKTIRHGDCWNNNFLFRYSAVGVPIECRLLDFQCLSLGTVTMDLHHFLFPSLAAKFRQKELPNLLTYYYANFTSVLAGTSVAMEFSLPELKQEFHDNLLFGCMMALSLVPILLLKPEEVPNFEDFFSSDVDEMENSMIKFKLMTNELTRKSPSFRTRLLDMFDELRDYGFFKSSSVAKLVRTFSQIDMGNSS